MDTGTLFRCSQRSHSGHFAITVGSRVGHHAADSSVCFSKEDCLRVEIYHAKKDNPSNTLAKTLQVFRGMVVRAVSPVPLYCGFYQLTNNVLLKQETLQGNQALLR